MKVEIDPNAGFCFGVKNTIERAEKELEEGNSIYCLGEMVHNDEEIRRLESLGLVTIDFEYFKTLKNAKVLIRAHGEPPETYQIAKKNNIELIDTTCPIVSRLQNRIRTCNDEIIGEKGQIIIFGKEGHAEVVGLVGQTGGDAIVISQIEDLDQIDFARPVYLYSQTTKSKKEFGKIKKEIEKRKLKYGHLGDSHFKSYQTICGQVSNREPNLIVFAKKHDIILFVSGKKSSNGKMLFEVCKKVNPNSHFISSPGEVEIDMVKGHNTVGISGATSTPTWLLKDVASKVLSFEK